MPYDPNLDEKLFTESADFERTRVSVSVHSYNGGTPKVQISRENFNAEGEPSFAKLGRLTKEEAEKVMPMLQKAIEAMPAAKPEEEKKE